MPPSTPSRNLSIDVLRGLTLALMIVVNTPGSWGTQYAPLVHAAWHGYSLTDLVFPSFLFVVGCALRLSMKKLAAMDNPSFLRTVFKRGILIFLCGFFLYWFPFFTADGQFIPFDTVRVMGVLQRIGLCYLVAALVVRYGGVRGALATSAALLLGYWWILWQFGDYTLAGNAVRTLDLAVLGASHMYTGDGIPFDPEGILSTLPAVVNVLGGYLAVAWLEHKGRSVRTVAALFVAGAACVLLAHGWDGAFPINKKLWTSAYVVCSVGWNLALLAVLVWAIDMRGLRAGTYFFDVFGKNTLFIYMLSTVGVVALVRLRVGGMSLYQWLYARAILPWTEPYLASFLFALGYMLACWLVAYAMDRRGIYVKL
ncbi:acyltransferase family protein [Massilia sp. HP4]|uniref:acyltransferase family protein n=1 Tax=Massilia sp. HP4 TaxID=2562316 RepID=UPI0010C012A0|nr:heparan-alpha-glucosaminide N-acetyltransferase domain-containing protein [Massilia sp. HP4]